MVDAARLTRDQVDGILLAFEAYMDARPRPAPPVDAKAMRDEGFARRLTQPWRAWDGVDHDGLPEEHVAFAVAALETYVRVCRENGYGGFGAGHSALARRLLSGKPPLPKPPPLCEDYPWYALAEGERVEIRRMARESRVDAGRAWWAFWAPRSVSIHRTLYDVLSRTRLRERRSGEVYVLSRPVKDFEHNADPGDAPPLYLQKEASGARDGRSA